METLEASPPSAEELIARLERELPQEEKQKASEADKRADRQLFFSQTARDTRRRVFEIDYDRGIEFTRAMDAENKVKLCRIARLTLLETGNSISVLSRTSLEELFKIRSNTANPENKRNGVPAKSDDTIPNRKNIEVRASDPIWMRLINILGMVKNNCGAFARKLVEIFLNDVEFSNSLTAAFNEAGYELTPKTAQSPVPTLALPDKAPKLWKDRDPKTNAAEFIREVYKPWIENSALTRSHLLQIDKPLYLAYAQWIRPSRHPDDAITFAEGTAAHFIISPKEAIDRRRESGKAASARYREKKRSEPTVSF